MDRVRKVSQLVVSVLIVAGFVAGVLLIADTFGAWDVLKAQQQARAAEARARELEAQAAVLREKQSIIQTMVLAFASTKDSVLVTVTYLGGGVLLVLCAVLIGVLLLERGKRYDRYS